MDESLPPLSDKQIIALSNTLFQSFDEILCISKEIFNELFNDIVEHNNDTMMFNISLALSRQYPDMNQDQNSLSSFKIMHLFLGKLIKYSEESNNAQLGSSYESSKSSIDLTCIYYNWLRLAINSEESGTSSGVCNSGRQDDRGETPIMGVSRIRH